MPFQPGQSVNPGGRRKEKPWRDALTKAVNDLLEGDPKGRKHLQAIAEKVVAQAVAGDMRAAEEIGNRLDGKVPQALIGSDDPDDPPVALGLIGLVPVAPMNDADRPPETLGPVQVGGVPAKPEGGQ